MRIYNFSSSEISNYNLLPILTQTSRKTSPVTDKLETNKPPISLTDILIKDFLNIITFAFLTITLLVISASKPMEYESESHNIHIDENKHEPTVPKEPSKPKQEVGDEELPDNKDINDEERYLTTCLGSQGYGQKVSEKR